jgi:IclR family transcriptional regulator, acetate operon repressor
MIKSIMKAIKIMQLFNESETRLSVTEISQKVDIPKSTAHNILKTLLSEGFIEKVDGDIYALSTAPLVLTQNIRVNVEIRDPAAPLLRQLADLTRESVLLTVRDRDSVLYIYAIESPQRLLARTAVGDRGPFHCTSVGKAILAFLPEKEIDAILKRVDLRRYTQNTNCDVNTIREELKTVRSLGYSTDSGEHEDGTFCIGAPIFDRRGVVIASCSLSSTDPSLLTTRINGSSRLVVETAQEISRRMGYVPNHRIR